MSTQTLGGYGETHYDILRYLVGWHSTTEILAFIGSDPRGYTRRLIADKLVTVMERKGGNAYVITTKGQRLLAKVDAGHGDVAGPRQAVSNEPYTGEKWSVRAGSEPQHGYRRPMLIASSVMPGKGVL